MNSKGTATNVVFASFGGKKAEPQAKEQVENTRASVTAFLKNKIINIIQKPAEAALIKRGDGSTHCLTSRPAYGPYNAFIYYDEQGKPTHTASRHIDKLRAQRKHTRNAIEIRCDALALAVYVSGITQINIKTEKAMQGVRVVAYEHDKLEASVSTQVGSAEKLVEQLYSILVNTYNRLSKEYNLAGFTAADLTLVSTSEVIPNIRIDMV